ncbi:FAD/FMN-containing dehydrogenase [Angulomicrobium tetraedrale]|uniref:FAD/FMN-containing dehydrogenase n=1 Tax=Ancylobacter tetraedralis TaxID=217068 RepID=A0A839ZC99_9HYPH|nr:FAD-binding oxidoreductase [Ancylobacter tetraedralis]MBB3772316.1 FAD/FMN-containing dehydrogenase [Ancylobacter tetraedralis]
MAHDIAALKARLAGIALEDNPALVRQKSRDFFWYSPTLKRQLDSVAGALIATPSSEGEVLRILEACFALGIPVTPRGAGTGNYGQAMPLAGGLVLDMSGLDKVLEVAPGRVRAQAGAIIAEIDTACRSSGQELRLHPSTYRTASIGGFIAGGSGGVGSITWGGLRDLGNIIGLRIVTMEATPRILELTGEEVEKVAHAYGTNGIILEVEMPLAPAYDWIEAIIGFGDFTRAAAFANALGEQDAILKKLLSVISAPIPQDYFLRHRPYLPAGEHVVLAMIAPIASAAFDSFTARWGGRVLFHSDRTGPEEARGLPPLYELAWNHTTLRALRVDPAITYLQTLYPFPDQLALVARIHEELGDEVPAHLEFVRFDGKITCFGLPLVRFTDETRLEAIIARHEALGIPVFNPHRYTLEEGGMKQTDAVQLAFKREADPAGLLNPGKMIAWENPDFDFSTGRTYLFPGLSAQAREE